MEHNRRDLFVLQDDKYFPVEDSFRLKNGDCLMEKVSAYKLPVHKRVANFDVKNNPRIDFCWDSCNKKECPSYRLYKKD